MKFNKAISRDVEISGSEFVVGLDSSGVTFRLKGKRKVVQVDWQTVLDSARGENGEHPAEFLGLGKVTKHHTAAPIEDTHEVEETDEDEPAEPLSHTASAGDHHSEG